MPPRSRGWPTWRASSCIRIRSAPRSSIIPTSCASISIRCPGVEWRQVQDVAKVVRATLDDLGTRRLAEDVRLAGHSRQRAHPSAVVVHRGAPRRPGAGARSRTPRAGDCHQQVVEGRAPRRLHRLQPECEGQDGLLRVFGAAASRRARLDAAHLGRDRCLRSRRLHAEDHAGVVQGERRSPCGHRSASGLARDSCSSCRRSRRRTGRATRHGRRNTRSSRASRRASSLHAAKAPRGRLAGASKHPLIVIAHSTKKEEALELLEKWKEENSSVTPFLQPADILTDPDARAIVGLVARPDQSAARARSVTAGASRSCRRSRIRGRRYSGADRGVSRDAPKTSASS